MATGYAEACGEVAVEDFTDGLARSVGPTGDVHLRNAMSLTNVVYNARQNWANPTLTDLRQQGLPVNPIRHRSSWAGATTHNRYLIDCVLMPTTPICSLRPIRMNKHLSQ